VKDRVGRNRYIAFRVEGGKDIQTGEVIRALREASHHLPEEARPWLVHLRNELGVVRVSHLHKDTAIPLLQAIKTVGDRDVKLHTLGTSGTIRQAIRKYLERLSPGRETGHPGPRR
jgi:RNase P/RNase MRP subunit POP5